MKKMPFIYSAFLFIIASLSVSYAAPDILTNISTNIVTNLTTNYSFFMVSLEGGSFIMGDSFAESEAADERPAHIVKLSRYAISRYEVTCEFFDLFCLEDERTPPDDAGFGRGNRPAVNVNWYDAVEFCNWLSRREGLRPCYSVRYNVQDAGNFSTYDEIKATVVWDREANGYRLPTEAEWEYAARERGKDLRFGNGQNIADPAKMNFDGSIEYKKRYSVSGIFRERTLPVGSFEPSALGLYDMSGNAWEWCWDWYAQYSTNQSENPSGPQAGSYRVLRGGSWFSGPEALRCANRFYDSPHRGSDVTGFRVVRSLQ